ncbi:hypothetical protein [Devosia sp. RR2S18]|uniref:hypothetical protein n=1 Tax=Devosia rhizosphaerae TaxID=3049774 RepID=UPI0025414D9A|nr:hypothetical protein [Devosia sp. RR2S18]WIJ23922.1 hypothetical protein QOV41_12830 [Devosia sp. RR2S18]
MRKVLKTFFVAGLLGLSSIAGVNAQTLEDAVERGRALFTNCEVIDLDLEEPLVQPLEDISNCCAVEYLEPALQEYSAYVAELVAAGSITEAEALALFQKLRDIARELGCGDVIDALFEQLFPDTAFVGAVPAFSGIGAGTAPGGGAGPVVLAPPASP